jgi:hypothetical protein
MARVLVAAMVGGVLAIGANCQEVGVARQGDAGGDSY